MKGVFDTKPNSGYDDEIVERYQFPSNYLSVAESLVGDWIVYREPQRNRGRRAYVATARVLRIDPDPIHLGSSYAVIRDFLPFDNLVPIAPGGVYAEAPLRAIGDPRRVGVFLRGRSVRALSPHDFASIVNSGLGETLSSDAAIALEAGELAESGAVFAHVPEETEARRIEQILLNRKVRDANFRRQVCSAYENRCAVTGLRIINGGGRAEAQAAHIWSVIEGGPDVVQNGLALSGTAHWLFDRHLISLTDDYRLLVSHNKVPSEFRALFERQLERIHLPAERRLWPHPTYLARHREAFCAASS